MTEYVWDLHIECAKKAIRNIEEEHPEFITWLNDAVDDWAETLSHPWQSKAHKKWIQEKALLDVVRTPECFIPRERIMDLVPVGMQLSDAYTEQVDLELAMFKPEIRPIVPDRFGEFIGSSALHRAEGLFGCVIELFQHNKS